MFWILLSLIFIRPLISSLAFSYLNSIYSALLFIFLIIWFFSKGISLNKIKSLRFSLILFCLALIISVTFSTDKLNSFKELYKYIISLLLFFIITALEYKDKIRVIHTIVLTGFVISLLAIYQYFFGFQHVLEYIAKEKISNSFVLDYIGRKRVFFPFITPNTLAGYLAMIIPLTLTYKDSIWFIIPLSFALLLTKSLGAFLSLFLTLVIYFYLQDKLEKRRILFLSGLLVIIVILFTIRTMGQKQYLKPLFSTVMRLNYWKDTLGIIITRPLTGVGLGNFNLVLSRYAHNSYLQIWAEMGILGIISFIWIITSIFKSIFQNIKISSYKKQTIGLLTANIVFLIHNLIDFSLFLPEVSLIWWIILGLSFF